MHLNTHSPPSDLPPLDQFFDPLNHSRSTFHLAPNQNAIAHLIKECEIII